VKIQAPLGSLPSSATLNVRSESAWPYPINTQTPIRLGNAPVGSDIHYNGNPYTPIEICYDSNNTGTFNVILPAGSNADSYYWETNAGTISNRTTTQPSVTVNFNTQGLNRYIRVKTTNNCGTSAWYTKYFDLTYQSFGCSGGGGGGPMFSIITYPNPSSAEMSIELQEEDELKQKGFNRKTNEKFEYTLFNSDLEVVYNKKTSSKKETVPVKDLPKGKYILRIVTPYGSDSRQVIINR
tara:strand:- start:12621 stop:13337 length:717 start_codon:yes stop_codon:yes gene_type:complete